jgi:hypothetical protein
MQPGKSANEISIKVPAPFAGVGDLGFTAQYRPQEPYQPLVDVPLLIEGPPPAMRRLADRLRLLREAREVPYEWSDPIMLSDEVVVMAFRDRSLQDRTLADGAIASLGYTLNLVKPVVFTFLHDCALVAGLKLADRIEIKVIEIRGQIAQLGLRPEQIVRPNGSVLLWP